MNPFKLIIMHPCGWILRQLYLLTGREYLVIKVDSTAATVGFIM